MILLELSSVDQSFANAVKMLLIKSQNDGVATLPMQELVQRLNKMGFSASNQIDAIRGLIATFKAMRPFFNYMSEVLTTDLNGENLY